MSYPGLMFRWRMVGVDALVAVTLGVLVVAYAVGWGPDGQQIYAYRGWQWLAPAVVVASVFIRRRLPWAMLAVALVTDWIMRAADITSEPFSAAVALFSIAAARGRRAGVRALVVSGAVVVASVPLIGRSPSGAVQCLIFYVLGAALGTFATRLEMQGLRARALERIGARHRARLVVLEGRAQVAGEVHDVLTGSTAVVARLADAAALSLERGDTAAAGACVQHVSDISRATLLDMRRVISSLRTDGEASREGSDEQCVEMMVSGLRTLGTDVRVSVVGAPSPASAPLAGRVLREALTNVIRHSTARRVRVDVLHADDGSGRLTVANDGVTSPDALGSGLGLARIREEFPSSSGRPVQIDGETWWRLDVTTNREGHRP